MALALLDASRFVMERINTFPQFFEIDRKEIDWVVDEVKAKEKLTVKILVVAVCQSFSSCKSNSIFDGILTRICIGSESGLGKLRECLSKICIRRQGYLRCSYFNLVSELR